MWAAVRGMDHSHYIECIQFADTILWGYVRENAMSAQHSNICNIEKEKAALFG